MNFREKFLILLMRLLKINIQEFSEKVIQDAVEAMLNFPSKSKLGIHENDALSYGKCYRCGEEILDEVYNTAYINNVHTKYCRKCHIEANESGKVFG